MEKLPEDQFSKVHRNYVVAHDKIVTIRNRKISLIGREEFPSAQAIQIHKEIYP